MRECQVELCFGAQFEPTECVGESVTSAVEKCAVCKGEVYMHIDTLTLSLSRACFVALLTRQNCERHLFETRFTSATLTNSFDDSRCALPLSQRPRGRDLRSSSFGERHRHRSFTNSSSCSNCFPEILDLSVTVGLPSLDVLQYLIHILAFLCYHLTSPHVELN